ncbi:unnamed protein product [Lactuca virosa]|uniref:Uncharacterized protein n=1 Tax=Lactuca virosa TaxID=75947 RepID=A0AAU9N1M6_9ASTR|nr:unnamed protein product [Lactuca virosa]
MAKFGTSSKKPVALSQPKAFYKTTSCNLQAVLDTSLYDVVLAPMIEPLKGHPLSVPLIISTNKVPFEYLVRAHDTASFDNKLDRVELELINGDTVYLKKHIFLESNGLPREVIFSCYKTPSTTKIFRKLLSIGHKAPLENNSHFKKTKLPIAWNFLVLLIIHCLTEKTGETGQLSTVWLQILWGIITGRPVDYVTYIRNDFKEYIGMKNMEIPHTHFWAVFLESL